MNAVISLTVNDIFLLLEDKYPSLDISFLLIKTEDGITYKVLPNGTIEKK